MVLRKKLVAASTGGLLQEQEQSSAFRVRPAFCEGPCHTGSKVVEAVHALCVEKRIDVRILSALNSAKKKCHDSLAQRGLGRQARAQKRFVAIRPAVHRLLAAGEDGEAERA